MGPLALPIAIVILTVGILIVLTRRLMRSSRGGIGPSKAIQMPCTVCQQSLVIAPGQLTVITGPEVALVVRETAGAEGHPLAGYRCPYCEAFHVFTMDANPPEWLIANPFEAQAVTNLCTECRAPLLRPPWPKGQHDGHLEEAEGLLPKHGLVCSRCGAVCCVACCQDSTRGRTQDGSLLCPRCFRGPVDKIHHF